MTGRTIFGTIISQRAEGPRRPQAIFGRDRIQRRGFLAKAVLGLWVRGSTQWEQARFGGATSDSEAGPLI